MEPMGHSPHILEILYWISQIVLVLIAAVGAWFAYHQLKALNSSRDQQLNITRATFLLELDKRWESADMQEARDLFVTISGAISKDVEARNPGIAPETKQDLIAEQWKRTLADLLKTDTKKYMKLFYICGLFETIGKLVKNKYLSLEDISDLFSGPIEQIGRRFGPHISDREKEGMRKGLYEHALYLYDEIIRQDQGSKVR
jgi:hypothetical protein